MIEEQEQKFKRLLFRFLGGERLSRRERKDLDTWLLTQQLSELEHLCAHFGADRNESLRSVPDGRS